MIFELQKISILKRISAFLLDIILLATLAVGFAWLISLMCHYDDYIDDAITYYEEYANYETKYKEQLETSFGVPFQESLKKLVDADYDTLSEADKVARDEYTALTPVQKVNYTYTMVYNLMLLMTSIGILLAYITLEFIVPLCLKNGQTVGKKIFGICLVRPDCVKISTMALFTRTFLGKYTVETMVPVFIVYLILFAQIGIIGILVLAALLIFEIVLFFATKNKTPIHDIFAGTVAVDKTSQMIFGSEEELVAKKLEFHTEQVEKTKA